MTTKDSSLQSQNPISSAQNSVDNVHQAVNHALSHPTAQTTEEAHNAIAKAENSVVRHLTNPIARQCSKPWNP